MNTVNILGAQVSCASRQDLLATALRWTTESQKRTILYVNAYCLNLAARLDRHREDLNSADLVYPDGVSVVWASLFLGGCPLEKITGRDWITDVARLAAEDSLRLFILAGQPGVADKARQDLEIRFPGIQIVGVHPGYFDQRETPAVIASINRAAPHILWVGMGSPRQERWLTENRQQIDAPVCWAVGALFDYIAKVEPEVPAWMNKLALEWLWRLMVNPRGKWRRYLWGNPEFIARIVHQKWKQRGA